MRQFIILLSCSYFIIVLTQTTEDTDRCVSKNTCGDCIQIPKCAWNIRPIDGQSHCIASSQNINENIVNPKTEGHISDNSQTNHLSLKKINLKIRPGESYNFNFIYKHKKQYPLDIYFLMDMSKSMQFYRDKISVLANDLVRTMREKSDEVKIGFGSFVDKTTLPYINTVGDKILKPCSNCEIPYSFKNHLSLTTDVAEFSNQVNGTPISANIDGPEGSLEALLQVIVCTDEIGWRENARHLIILSTDDSFHVAGDGKLAGIVEPNDGECHLVNNEYNYGLKQDYPSIGQIRDKAANKSMNILFVVPPAQEKLYGKLQEAIKNSYLGTLQSSFDNIVKLVEDFYDKITASVSINHNFDINNFNIKISSKSCKIFKNNTCHNIMNNEDYEFAVQIGLNSCPSDKTYKRNYFIKPSALSEQINIDLEMLCDCSCEHPGNKDFEKDSEKCSQQGDLQCGVCICKPNKIGNHCQCDSESTQQNIDDSNCQKPGTNEICSGNGQCKCGQCTCNHPFSGNFCHCNNDLCVINGETCSNHGICNCGKCDCNEEWSGNKCECTTKTDSCVHPESMEICSGNGDCKCGKCICSDKVKYGGQYCDECKTCPKSCNDFEGCVRCHYNSDKCNLKCNKFEIYETLDKMNISQVEKLCEIQDDQNCLIKFTFSYNQTNGLAEIYTQRVCTPSQAGLYASISIIGAILITAFIAFIIWKICSEIEYRKEYKEFKNDTTNPKWSTNNNPLFKDPISKFQNPLFEKSN